MKVILGLLIVLAAAAGITYMMQSSQAASPSAPQSSTPSRVSVVRSSDDGRETFSLRIFAPWPDAPHRVIALNAAGIENNGMVSMSYVSTLDSDTDEEFTAAGPRNRMIVRRNVGSWAEVLEDSHITVRVEPNR